MPETPYLEVTIGGQKAELEGIKEFPLTINYKLEDPDNFQTKTSSEAFNVKLPGTLQNERIANSYHNPSVEDNSPGQVYRSHRQATIVAAGQTMLTGKAFLTKALHGNKPESYEYNFYGDNGDWIVDLKEKTLYDFLQHIVITFSSMFALEKVITIC